jgi:hypothetical protein
LRLDELGCGHLSRGNAAVAGGALMTRHRRQIEPGVGADEVPRHTLAQSVYAAQIVQRLGIAAVGQ